MAEKPHDHIISYHLDLLWRPPSVAQRRSAVVSRRCDLPPKRSVPSQLKSISHRYSRVPADLMDPCGERSARCRCKIRYASKFTTSSRGSPCDSTAFLYWAGFSYAISKKSNENVNRVLICFISAAFCRYIHTYTLSLYTYHFRVHDFSLWLTQNYDMVSTFLRAC